MTVSSVVEEEVEVRTADGRADAFFYRWTEGQRPGVIFFPDGIGTRASQRDMARRVAEQGYNVLLPNIYYRTARAPFFPPRPDFRDEKVRSRFGELTAPLSPVAMERDGSAYIDYLASRSEVSDGPMGVIGFCFSGAFALRTAAARPDRVAAAASFHGGGLYKDDASSPHTALNRVRARLLIAHARDDRSMPSAAIASLDEALAKWGGRYESETYNAFHGWTVPDHTVYDKAEAERAFSSLIALFEATLSR